MYSELDYVNVCLGTMGESPVPDLTIPHPYISQALVFLARHNKLVQSQRWWFNTTKETLIPVAPSYSVLASLPAGAIAINGMSGNAYVLNDDGSVYDVQGNEVVTTTFDAFVVREVSYVLLPVEANAYVSDCAVLQFQQSFDGDSQRTRDLKEAKAESFARLHAANIRLTKANLFMRGSMQSKLYDMRGDRPMLRGSE